MTKPAATVEMAVAVRGVGGDLSTPVEPDEVESLAQINVVKIRDIGEVSIGDEPITIGRASDNTIVLPSNSVSRRHCVFERDGDTVRLRDLNSHFGTRVNGTRISETVLQHGDEISVGRFLVRFVDPEHAPDESPTGNDRATAVAGQELDRREQELAERAAQLESQHETLQCDLAKLDEERDRLCAERDAFEQEIADWQETQEYAAEQFEQRSAKLDRREAELDEREAGLGEKRLERLRDLDQRENALQTERAAWEDERSSLQARIAEIEQAQSESNERHHDEAAKLREEISRLQSELANLRTEAAESKAALTTARAEALAERAEELESVRNELNDTRAKREAAHLRAEGLERDLTDQKRRFKEMKERWDAERKDLTYRLKTAQKEATERAGTAERAIAHLAEGAKQLRKSSQRLSSIQAQLRAYEQSWIETEELISEVDQADPETAALVRQQHDTLTQQLEEAHVARDGALNELQKLVESFAALTKVQHA